jgi:hypothetical protein
MKFAHRFLVEVEIVKVTIRLIKGRSLAMSTRDHVARLSGLPAGINARNDRLAH